jgi:hypothetical protein
VQCERHGLAAGPDGKCALCHRQERELDRALHRGRDPGRRVAILVVAIAAAIAAFLLAGALFDTR